MTNVPDRVRNMWTDLYKLFDSNWKMENTEGNWERFWEAGKELIDKHEGIPEVSHFVILCGNLIGEHMKGTV